MDKVAETESCKPKSSDSEGVFQNCTNERRCKDHIGRRFNHTIMLTDWTRCVDSLAAIIEAPLRIVPTCGTYDNLHLTLFLVVINSPSCIFLDLYNIAFL